MKKKNVTTELAEALAGRGLTVRSNLGEFRHTPEVPGCRDGVGVESFNVETSKRAMETGSMRDTMIGAWTAIGAPAGRQPRNAPPYPGPELMAHIERLYAAYTVVANSPTDSDRPEDIAAVAAAFAELRAARSAF